MATPGTWWSVVTARAVEPVQALGELGQWARQGGLPLAVVLLLVAVALLVLAARHDRVAGAAAGVLVGALVARSAAAGVGSQFSLLGAGGLMLLAAGGLGLLGGLWPRLGAFAAGALPGALLAAPLGSGDGELPAMILGGLAFGIAAALLERIARAVAISALAATALVGAALALAGKARLAAELVARPMTLVAGIALLTVAGTAWRLGLGAPAPAPRPAAPMAEDDDDDEDDEA